MESEKAIPAAIVKTPKQCKVLSPPLQKKMLADHKRNSLQINWTQIQISDCIFVNPGVNVVCLVVEKPRVKDGVKLGF